MEFGWWHNENHKNQLSLSTNWAYVVIELGWLPNENAKNQLGLGTNWSCIGGGWVVLAKFPVLPLRGPRVCHLVHDPSPLVARGFKRCMTANRI